MDVDGFEDFLLNDIRRDFRQSMPKDDDGDLATSSRRKVFLYYGLADFPTFLDIKSETRRVKQNCLKNKKKIRKECKYGKYFLMTFCNLFLKCNKMYLNCILV